MRKGCISQKYIEAGKNRLCDEKAIINCIDASCTLVFGVVAIAREISSKNCNKKFYCKYIPGR